MARNIGSGGRAGAAEKKKEKKKKLGKRRKKNNREGKGTKESKEREARGWIKVLLR